MGEGRPTPIQYIVDRCLDHVSSSKHIMIPEPKDNAALASEPCISFQVVLAIRVLPSIHLHDQPRGVAHEVHDIRPDRVLAFEFPAA